jgi:hypothetical protein
MTTLTKQVKIILVQYTPDVDAVLINVVPQVVLNDGTVYEQPFLNIQTTQTELTAATAITGNTTGIWGDAEVSVVVNAAMVPVTTQAPTTIAPTTTAPTV